METKDLILDETGTVLLGVAKSATSVVIPDTVKIIAKGAFFKRCHLKSVIMGKSVTIIKDHAFKYCSHLEYIDMSAPITKIGCCAFYGCPSLKVISIPDTVKEIGDAAFYDCPSLEKVSLPPSLKTIGKVVFWGCRSIGEITIPASVREIGQMSFNVCPSLKVIRCNVQNPAKVNIDEKAFDTYAFSICTVIVPSRKAYERNKVFGKFEKLHIDNAVLDETGSILLGVRDKNERMLAIPSSVREFAKGALDGYTSLREVYCGGMDPNDIVFHENPFCLTTVINGTVFVKTGTMKKYCEHVYFRDFTNKTSYLGQVV